MAVHEAAFGQPDEARLTAALLDDPTAAPTLSLLAEEEGDAVGHVLFTAARIEGAPTLRAALLAPLAVAPDAQGRGVGSALVRAGLERLQEAGVDLVCVLGDPAYYGRFGFRRALPEGPRPPQPIPDSYEEGWRVLRLSERAAAVDGRLLCADAIDDPVFWAE